MLKEIEKILKKEILEELKTIPNQGVIWEIIEKRVSGKILELPSQSILIVENCSEPFVFLAGQLTHEDLELVLFFLNQLDAPFLYCSPNYHHFFLKQNWNFHLRVELSLKKEVKAVAPQSGLEIKPITSINLFKNCVWYALRSEIYGSDENFLKYGMGYVLCEDDTVLSEGYLSQGRGYGEIGIATHPHHKKKGYASLMVGYLIQECQKNNIVPKWSCNADNRASLHTALKMGFEIDGYYILLIPKRGNVLSKNLD